MRFQLVAPDCDYAYGLKSGGINGGTVWLDNICQALNHLGHDAFLSQTSQKIDADYAIVQSEFIENRNIIEYKQKGGKVICLVSHFKCDHYPPIERVKELSDILVTPYEGLLTASIDALYLPHAYNDLADDGKVESRGEIVFSGNSYDLRREDWFEGLDITRINGLLPKDLPAIYRGADVCVNIHGGWQKGDVSHLSCAVADKPGYLINERFWHVLGSGGLLVTDWVPSMEKWFKKDELIVANTKKEFQELVKYYNQNKKAGLALLDKAIERVRREHTYVHRVEKLLKLC